MRSCGVDWNQTSRLTPSPKVSFLACVRPHAAGHERAYTARPGHDALHLAEELIAPRAPLLQGVLGDGKAALAHADMLPPERSPHITVSPEKSTSPQ